MNRISKNIKKIRVLKNLSQQVMSETIGITRATLASYEEGRAEPKLSVATEIANKFNITLEDLLNKELSVNDLLGYKKYKTAVNESKSNSEIRMVKNNTDIEERLILPCIAKETHKCFEVYDNSLNMLGNGLQAKDVVIAIKINNINPDNLQLGSLHVVVTKNNYFIGKLDLAVKGIKLLFYNDGYADKKFLLDDIIELYIVEKAFIQNIKRLTI